MLYVLMVLVFGSVFGVLFCLCCGLLCFLFWLLELLVLYRFLILFMC